ncbi:hypothetical protein AURDEDRAFT_157065 [Auricularia subglabra TFB-10046 SS5]|nr:hypothetical protein AURDEDRAFT_157065 [Auricularia subglabra TFB-10046 SS5]
MRFSSIFVSLVAVEDAADARAEALELPAPLLARVLAGSAAELQALVLVLAPLVLVLALLVPVLLQVDVVATVVVLVVPQQAARLPVPEQLAEPPVVLGRLAERRLAAPLPQPPVLDVVAVAAAVATLELLGELLEVPLEVLLLAAPREALPREAPPEVLLLEVPPEVPLLEVPLPVALPVLATLPVLVAADVVVVAATVAETAATTVATQATRATTPVTQAITAETPAQTVMPTLEPTPTQATPTPMQATTTVTTTVTTTTVATTTVSVTLVSIANVIQGCTNADGQTGCFQILADTKGSCFTAPNPLAGNIQFFVPPPDATCQLFSDADCTQGGVAGAGVVSDTNQLAWACDAVAAAA